MRPVLAPALLRGRRVNKIALLLCSMAAETTTFFLALLNLSHRSIRSQKLPIVGGGIEAARSFDHDRQMLWLCIVGRGKFFPNNDRAAWELNGRFSVHGLTRKAIDVNNPERAAAALMRILIFALFAA